MLILILIFCRFRDIFDMMDGQDDEHADMPRDDALAVC